MQSYFESAWPKVLSASIGTFVLAALVMVLEQVGLIGGLVEFALSIVALGAVVLTRFGTRDYKPTDPFTPRAGKPGQRTI